MQECFDMFLSSSYTWEGVTGKTQRLGTFGTIRED